MPLAGLLVHTFRTPLASYKWVGSGGGFSVDGEKHSCPTFPCFATEGAKHEAPWRRRRKPARAYPNYPSVAAFTRQEPHPL